MDPGIGQRLYPVIKHGKSRFVYKIFLASENKCVSFFGAVGEKITEAYIYDSVLYPEKLCV